MPAGSGAATSSTGWARPSSRWPARSTGCGPPASRPTARATGAVHLLAAADPANPYGAALPWPRRGETDRRPLQRAAGAYVVLVDGVAALYLERGGATLQTLPAADDPGRGGHRGPCARARWSPTGAPASWSSARSTARTSRRRRSANGCSRPGFVAGYRGLVLRAARTGSLSARGRHALPDGGGTAAVPRRPDGQRGTDRRARRGPAGRPDRRPRDRRGRGARQEPADPVRQRAGDPDAPADERVVASLPAGRALAAAAGAGAARHRGPGRRRGLLRRAGRRAPRAARRGAPPVARRARAGPARARSSTPRRRVRRLRDPARAATAIGEALLDQRALAGIGNVYKNEVLWIERVSPFAPVATSTTTTLARLVATARRLLRRQRHGDPRPRTRHDGRRPRRARSALRLRPDRATVPPLPDADRQQAPGERIAAHDLLVPGLPAEPSRDSGGPTQSNMPSGQCAVTTKCGTSTISLMRRSIATLHRR